MRRIVEALAPEVKGQCYIVRSASAQSVNLTSESFLPCALSIGGLDPGGGAGLAADLRAFAEAGAFGCAVMATWTVQSTRGLRSIESLPSRGVIAQATEVVRNQNVRAVKTGALGSEENVRAIARWLRSRDVPVVVDPVTLPTRGQRHSMNAPSTLRDLLLPRATLVTANVSEALALTGIRVRTPRDASAAAQALLRLGPRAALVKAGHLPGESADDFLAVGARVIRLRGTRLSVDTDHVHGTGCVLASLMAGRLAVRAGPALEDRDIIEAVRWAKRRFTRCLATACRVGRGLLVLA